MELLHAKPGTPIQIFRNAMELVHAKPDTHIQLYTDKINNWYM